MANLGSRISQGFAQVITRLQRELPTIQVDDPFREITQWAPDGYQSVANTPIRWSPLVDKFDNPLEQYASISYLWTFCCLTKQQFNDPRSYRNNPASLQNIVFSSAGRYDDQRVKTFFGSPEYFVNKFELESVITPSVQAGNSNVRAFKMEIYEPYSMGLFLQSLQGAAVAAGYPNYLGNVPFLFKLDIVGWDDLGINYSSIVSKYFPVKIRRTNFTVNEGGSTYTMEAIPYNHLGFSVNTNRISTDLSITGNTVKEILVTGERSLVAALTEQEEQQVNAGRRAFADQYEVQFPSTTDQVFISNERPIFNRATTDPNNTEGTTVSGRAPAPADYGNNIIGSSDLGFNIESGGNYNFNRDGDVRDENTGIITRGRMRIDPTRRAFQFTQGQSIQNIITQTVMSSRLLVENLAQNRIDSEGMVDWFMIDVQVQLMDWDQIRGDFSKKWIYRVVPYKAHSSVFQNPNATAAGHSNIMRRVAKRYEYIYTGQNNNVLNFDIKIEKMFFTGVNIRPESDTRQATDPNTQTAGDGARTATEVPQGSNPAAVTSSLGGRTIGPDYDNQGRLTSGSGDVTPEKKIAEAFQNALLKSNTDLVNVEMDILGDPYWLVDSGMGNYFSAAIPGSEHTTIDGTMNAERMDIHLHLTFRTPADIDESTGMYQFTKDGMNSPFSGLYRVRSVTSTFADGKFTQKLVMVRMPAQPQDFTNSTRPSSSGAQLALSSANREIPPSSVIDFT